MLAQIVPAETGDFLLIYWITRKWALIEAEHASTYIGYNVDECVRHSIRQYFWCGFVETRGNSMNAVAVTEETHVAQ